MRQRKPVFYRVIPALCAVALLSMLLQGCGDDSVDVGASVTPGDENNGDNGTPVETIRALFGFPPVDLSRLEFILPMAAV